MLLVVGCTTWGMVANLTNGWILTAVDYLEDCLVCLWFYWHCWYLALKDRVIFCNSPFFVQLKTGVSDQSVWSYKAAKITLQHCHCHSHISDHFAKLQWLTTAVNHTYTKGVYIAWIFFFIFKRSSLALCLLAGFYEVWWFPLSSPNTLYAFLLNYDLYDLLKLFLIMPAPLNKGTSCIS